MLQGSTQNAVMEVDLTKWVYDHTKQISVTTCKEIVQESLKTNKSLLILALIEVESNFISTAVSNKGAMGLGQIMPGVHEKELIVKGIIKERRDLFDIIPNIRATNHVLSSCLNQSKGDVSKALELYLGGQDGYYIKKISANFMNLYVLVNESGIKP
jgi:soluble lytic murein transglycosylase-like protein